MTESEWTTRNDPKLMLEFLRDKASDRKLRRFGVACCRRVWQYLKDERSRCLVEAAESFSDDTTTLQQLRVAFDQAANAQEAIHYEGGDAVDQSAAEAVLGYGCCSRFIRSSMGSTKQLEKLGRAKLGNEFTGRPAKTIEPRTPNITKSAKREP